MRGDAHALNGDTIIRLQAEARSALLEGHGVFSYRRVIEKVGARHEARHVGRRQVECATGHEAAATQVAVKRPQRLVCIQRLERCPRTRVHFWLGSILPGVPCACMRSTLRLRPRGSCSGVGAVPGRRLANRWKHVAFPLGARRHADVLGESMGVGAA